MIIIIAVIIIAMLFYSMGKYMERERQATDPKDREWGNGKDLSDLLKPLPMSELEDWWNATQSKDARIKELQAANSGLKALVQRQQDKLAFRESQYQNMLEAAGRLSRGGPAMILGKPVDVTPRKYKPGGIVLSDGVAYTPIREEYDEYEVREMSGKRTKVRDYAKNSNFYNDLVDDEWDY